MILFPRNHPHLPVQKKKNQPCQKTSSPTRSTTQTFWGPNLNSNWRQVSLLPDAPDPIQILVKTNLYY